jgi:hypothetical protein
MPVKYQMPIRIRPKAITEFSVGFSIMEEENKENINPNITFSMKPKKSSKSKNPIRNRNLYKQSDTMLSTVPEDKKAKFTVWRDPNYANNKSGIHNRNEKLEKQFPD